MFIVLLSAFLQLWLFGSLLPNIYAVELLCMVAFVDPFLLLLKLITYICGSYICRRTFELEGCF